MALLGPEGPEGARLLHVLLSQHAALLVPGLLASFNSTQDLGVSLVSGAAAPTAWNTQQHHSTAPNCFCTGKQQRWPAACSC